MITLIIGRNDRNREDEEENKMLDTLDVLLIVSVFIQQNI